MTRREIVIALLLAAAMFCVVFSYPVRANTVTLSTGASCEYTGIQVGKLGNVIVTCSGTPPLTPAPTNPPTPAPQPAPAPTPVACVTPPNVVMQTMFIGGTNNFVFDSVSYTNTGVPIQPSGGAANTIQVFPLPQTWTGRDEPVTHAYVGFNPYVQYSQRGVNYEIAFSRCPGDFAYYKTVTVISGGEVLTPCGGVKGQLARLDWKIGGVSDAGSCAIPSGEQWYMNWRPINCQSLGGVTCGQTFYTPYTP